MHPLIKKLQYKLQENVLIVNAPEEFEEVLTEFKRLADVDEDAVKGRVYPYVLVFVQTETDVRNAAKKYLPVLEPDAVFWMVYPKKTSSKYESEVTRDSGWASIGEHDYEGVSMVSIDENWSALRFRKVDFVKTMKRRESMRISKRN